MRHLLITLYVASLMGGILNAQVDKKLIRKVEKETLEKVQNLLPRYEKTASNLEDYSTDEINAMSAELQDLSSLINELIYNGTPSQGVRPTAERLATIKYWGEQIQPYNEVLANTALQYNRSYPYESFIARSEHLLNYTLSDEKLEQAARKVLNAETSNLVQSRKAARLLVEHRQFEDSDKTLLTKKRNGLTEKGEIRWAQIVAELGMMEALPIVERILATPLPDDAKTKEDVLNHLKILNQVSGIGSIFGEKASYLVPVLELRWREIKRIWPDFEGNFPEQIAALKGQKDQYKKRAINGSGYLDEPIDWETVGTVQNVKRPKSSSKQKPLTTNKKESDSGLTKQDFLEPEESPSRLPWIIAGVLLLGILLLLLKIFKGKSTS